MQAAIAAVREGRFKVREAGRHFGVPHSTLIDKVKGRVPEVRKMGRDTYFTEYEEKLLVKYIIASAKKGIPVKRNTLLETVKKILDDDKRVTPFKNNRPGKKWVTLFFKRHPEITEKKAEGISTAKANVCENDIKRWHRSLEEYLVEEHSLDILEDPKRIFNADESGFQTCPESGKVIGPVGMKNFYEIKSGREKEQVTVMVAINAAGQVVTPMIVYPLVRISKEIAINVPENWGIGKSPKGWMTGPLYYEYIANIFDPWVKANNIKKPILLLIDGHSSHLTLEVSQYCAENQILAYALFPNSTHISQPADVSVFKCLKSGWKNTVCEFKDRTGNRQITRAGFAPLLAKVFKDKVTPDVVANGFRKCGIYPFDVTAIDLTRCMDNDTRRTAPASVPPREIGVETLLLFESFMRQGRVEQFRRSNEQWEGEETAKELFYVWKKFRQHCLSETSPSSAETPRLQSITSLPQKTLPEEMNISTRSSTPVSKTPGVPEETKTSTICSTPVLMAPDLPEEGETSTRCSSSTISIVQYFPEMEETPTRSYTSLSKAPHLLKKSETPIRSCNRERLPFATTSRKWQDYWLAKENEKEEHNRKIEIRKRVREESKVKKSKQTKITKKAIKTSQVTNKIKKRVRVIRSDTSDTSELISDEELEHRIELLRDTETETEKEDEEEATKSFEVGNFVIFVYEGAFFVGRIDSICQEGALINSMHQSLKNWKWPEKEDLILYQIDDIKEKIKNPIILHQNRGLYHVPEFEKYREYI
ncbi:unnamed protein product [Pieris macdunnoughi]|uniref:Transposase n=1 Tax=Pieris macdunnoughi TaxID=345717 RepID=A0A821QTV7_9NEOP|nr:unnamed protein product [Pieris macdunnoughi]